MEQESYIISILTPTQDIELEVERSVIKRADEVTSVTISVILQGKKKVYQAETTEDALIAFAKDLPKNWCIKSCLSCRFGHFCPVGNGDNELFCVTDFQVKSPSDLWNVTEDFAEREKRSRTLFDLCDSYKKQSKDYFTYNDYLYNIKK